MKQNTRPDSISPGNNVRDNGGIGILGGGQTTIVIGNVIFSNGSVGLQTANYKDNVLVENNGGNVNAQVIGGLEIGINRCGADTNCP